MSLVLSSWWKGFQIMFRLNPVSLKVVKKFQDHPVISPRHLKLVFFSTICWQLLRFPAEWRGPVLVDAVCCCHWIHQNHGLPVPQLADPRSQQWWLGNPARVTSRQPWLVLETFFLKTKMLDLRLIYALGKNSQLN